MAVKQLSSDDFKKLITQQKNVWIIDVRELYEFQQGYIKGAKLMPSTRFTEELEKSKIKKTDKLALYCQSGSRSHFLSEQLDQLGYKNVFNLEIGLVEWLEYGKKLVK
ncbi:MAG: rhodanese-like domain-containing protein [Candidatus Moranbacteria bacterium]|nr:rhodanese-like domain-containing protein [Candidatus Moranbacteria bacterium]